MSLCCILKLINALYDIFIAGQETTANTIIFSVIYALNYPKKLKKLYHELDKVIGSDRRITLADRNSLSYCNAFIYEVQRLVNLLPQNLPHKLTKDVEIRGYNIPKNTVILPQVSSVLYDEKAFPNPETFIPERFLDSEGQPKKIDEFIPFSLGKRQCLGESLAKMELYLIIANFFNQYKLESENGSLPSMKKVPGVTVQPHPFKCSLKKRY
uniref:Cytochrome P450 n=1 Tax=Panagrolaimus davidi TaxID=227884 RepID=A0A914PIL7_9BILA